MWWYSIFFGIILAGLLYWQYWRWTHRRLLELASKLPGPPALPIIGNALIFMFNTDVLDKIAMLFEVYGQYLRFWLGPELNVCVKNPTDIRKLLTSHKINHKGPLYELMIPYIGPGILTGGPSWRNHRKIATPSYNKKSVDNFTSIFNTEAEQLAKVLVNIDPKTEFDIYKYVVQCTTQNVNQTLMGLSKEDSQNIYRLDEVVASTRRMYDIIFTKMTRWWLQIPFIFWLVGGKKEQDYFIQLVDEFAGDVVKKRKRALQTSVPDEENMGIVDRYILSGALTEKEIKWETMSLFTTSQEAAAKIASGVLLYLSHLPYWQERVYNEIIEVVGESEPVSSEQLKHMQYLDMVYKETLRCLSIAALIQRTVEEEITIDEGNITLPVGTSLVIPIHYLHRDSQFWEDPWEVKPERFLPENVKNRDPNAFVPFSLGPMDCLGRVFATALIKTIIVWVLREVKLQPVGSLADLKLDVAISVSIAGGYNVKIQPRRSISINGVA